MVASVAGGSCEGGRPFSASGWPWPRASEGAWSRAAPPPLGRLDQDEAETTGRASWGRESELDEEPTLLHDSEPEEDESHSVIYLS